MAVLDKGYISFSFSAKTRPRLSGRPWPPRPIRPGRGSQDQLGRATNKWPEPNTISPKHRVHRFLNKCPAPVQDAPKYRPEALSCQHHHWPQVAFLGMILSICHGKSGLYGLGWVQHSHFLSVQKDSKEKNKWDILPKPPTIAISFSGLCNLSKQRQNSMS